MTIQECLLPILDSKEIKTRIKNGQIKLPHHHRHSLVGYGRNVGEGIDF